MWLSESSQHCSQCVGRACTAGLWNVWHLIFWMPLYQLNLPPSLTSHKILLIVLQSQIDAVKPLTYSTSRELSGKDLRLLPLAGPWSRGEDFLGALWQTPFQGAHRRMQSVAFSDTEHLVLCASRKFIPAVQWHATLEWEAFALWSLTMLFCNGLRERKIPTTA